jgi:hypothetical protein
MMMIADLAFAIQFITISLGLYFLHLAVKEKSTLIKIGGYIMVIGGTLVFICTAVHKIKYIKHHMCSHHRWQKMEEWGGREDCPMGKGSGRQCEEKEKEVMPSP